LTVPILLNIKLMFVQLIRVLSNISTETFKLAWKSLTVFCKPIEFALVQSYSLTFRVLVCLAVIAIVLLIATMIFSVIVLRNFGRGLKEARKFFH